MPSIPLRNVKVATAVARPATARHVELASVSRDESRRKVDILGKSGKRERLRRTPSLAVPTGNQQKLLLETLALRHLAREKQLRAIELEHVYVFVIPCIDFISNALRIKSHGMAHRKVAERSQIKHLRDHGVIGCLALCRTAIPIQQCQLPLVGSLPVVKPCQRDGRRRKEHRIGGQRVFVTQLGQNKVLGLHPDFALQQPCLGIVRVDGDGLQGLLVRGLVVALHKRSLGSLVCLLRLFRGLGKSYR